MQPSCNHCAFRSDRPFCDMPTDAISRFDVIKEQATHRVVSIFFVMVAPSSPFARRAASASCCASPAPERSSG